MAQINGTTGRNSSYWNYYLICTEQNVDIASNTSKLKVDVYLGATSYSRAVRGAITATHTVNVNGTDYSFTTGAYTIEKNTNYLLGSITTNAITHNDDGSKTVTVTASSSDLAQASGYGPYSGSASGQVTLTTIARASSVTCADGNIGSSTTININRASSSFTHTLKYSFGTLSGTIATKTSDTSIGWTIPTSFYAQIPNATKGKGNITCETYSGNTLIGTKTCSFNAFVINSNPSISATVEDVNEATIALTGDKNKLVKYISNAKVVMTATAKNSATISSQKVVCGDGKSSTSATATLNAVESGKFTVSCTDSRGLAASTAVEKELIEYIKLALTEVSLARPATTSNTVNAVIKGNYFNSSFGNADNTLELKWRYRISGGTWSEYTTVTPTIDGNTFSYSASFGENYDYQSEYEFEIVAIDKLLTETITRIVTQGIPIIDVGKNDVIVNGETKAIQFTGPLNGNASSSSRVAHRGQITAETGTTKPALEGISMQRAYNNGYPITYGNVLNLLGGGASQLLLGWENTGLRGRIYYRSIRDTIDSWSSWGQIETATTIYNNTSGTTGTVTLSESAANFTYLEIFYKETQTSNEYSSTRIYSPNGKIANISIQLQGGANLYIMGARATISGTSITFSNNRRIVFTSNAVPYFDTSGLISVVQVLGYR